MEKIYNPENFTAQWVDTAWTPINHVVFKFQDTR